jgi:3-methylfumaryl-CoA hydratase
MIGQLRRHLPQARATRFSFRAKRPVFDIGPFTVCGAPDEAARRGDLWVVDPDGFLAMQGEVSWD